MKSLPSHFYTKVIDIGQTLSMISKVIIEKTSFIFEIYANYKYTYTVVEFEKSLWKIKKVIIYPDGTAFGGISNIFTNTTDN